MAEFEFYGTWEDSYVQLDRLTHLSRFIFVVDMDYEDPVVLQSRILSEDLMAVLKQRPHLYLYSDEYSRYPAGFHTSRRGFMWIDPHISGPALRLDLPICSQLEASLQLFAGSLSYLPSYQDPETGEWYRPPQALRQGYDEVRRVLRGSMDRRFVRSRRVANGVIKATVEVLWIGLKAVKMLEQGTACIQVGGEMRMGNDLARRRSELVPLADEDN